MLHIVFRYIQGYLEPRLVQACYVSGIFSHIYNVRHVEACLPTFEFRHIEDPCVTGSGNVNQRLLFKSASSFKYCSNLFGTFFYFFSKVNIPHFPLQDSISIMTIAIIIVCYPRQHATHITLLACQSCNHATHATHASMLSVQTRHPCQPCKQATHATMLTCYASMPPIPPILAQITSHF